MQTVRLAFADIAPDWDTRDNFFTRLFAGDAENAGRAAAARVTKQ